MALDKIAIGRMGEEEAARFLKKKGYKIIETNFRCRYGEIDIIAQDGDTYVFVEVKTRGSDAFGAATAAVDGRKQRRMITASTIYLSGRGLSDASIRFDVVGVDTSGVALKTELIRDAFSAVE